MRQEGSGLTSEASMNRAALLRLGLGRLHRQRGVRGLPFDRSALEVIGLTPAYTRTSGPASN